MSDSWRLKFRQKWLPYLVGKISLLLLKILASTCRFKVHNLDSFLKAVALHRSIVIFWHNRLTMVAEILHRFTPELSYVVVISQSRDGEIIATLTESYERGRVLRVPHNARAEAFKKMTAHLKYGKDILLLTPDGPRGPQYVVKPGVVEAAKETGASIIPMSWKASSFWQFKTWDKLLLPKPFSTIEVNFGEAIIPSVEKSQSVVCERLTEALLILQGGE